MSTGETDNARAYLSLKQMVLAGGFKPGEVVTLRALADRLAIGDTPVREAIKRLISEGAFEALPNRSARVPVMNRREIQQILDLRILLESNAAALAAQNITLHQIEQLRRLHKQMGAAVAADDSQTYGELNMAFHFEIYRIADNKTLATLDRGVVAAHGAFRLPYALAHHQRPLAGLVRRVRTARGAARSRCRLAMPRRRGRRCARICRRCRRSTAIGRASRTP